MTLEEIEKSKDLLKVYGFTQIEGEDTLSRMLPIFKHLLEPAQTMYVSFPIFGDYTGSVRLRSFETEKNVSNRFCTDVAFRDTEELEKHLIQRKEHENHCEKYYS